MVYKYAQTNYGLWAAKPPGSITKLPGTLIDARLHTWAHRKQPAPSANFVVDQILEVTQWHHVELIHSDLLRILHWAETDMDEEVTEPPS